MEYKIEKNIPVPERNKIRTIASKMNVEDSVFFEGPKGRSQGCNLLAHIKKLGFQGTFRKVEGGYRVWRIK
jgi:hypothetical protein